MHKQVLYSIIMVLSLILVSIFSTSPVFANDIDWHSYQEGLSESEHRGQPVMVYFYTDSCGYCRMMEDETFTERKVHEKSDDIVFVKVDANEERALSSQYEISGVPASIFTDSTGKEIQREVGFLDADQLVTVIDEVTADYNEEESSETDETTDPGSDNDVISHEDNFFRNMMVITVSSLVVAITMILSLNKMKKKDKQK
ncbi:MAG: thioredoxin family protein [Thermoplasmatota archaeon]